VSAADPKDVARLRQAFAAIEDDGASDPVDAERIFDALHGDLSPEERHAVIEQLVTNPAAAAAWRLAREMGPDAAHAGAPDRAPEERRQSAHWKWLSVAAAAVMATGLGWQLMQWRGADVPVYRSVESRSIASALEPGADLSRARPTLRWTGIDGARYRVRVLTADLQALDESPETSALEYTLNQETLPRIAPGAQILWQVEARIPGEVVITSPTFSTRVP
jgi:hypothetical protein